MNELLVLINKEGQLLEIDPKTIESDSILVPLEGYYEVFNEQRYDKAKWDFKLKHWVGVGEQRPIPTPQVDEVTKLKADVDYLLMITG